jgi:hypothetical protein
MYRQHRHLPSYMPDARLNAGQPIRAVGAGDKRRENRFPVVGVGTVHAINPALRKRLQALVLDMSRNGMKLRIERALDAGTEIQLLLRDVSVLGTVRYCIPVGDSFHIGIVVQKVLASPKLSTRRAQHSV